LGCYTKKIKSIAVFILIIISYGNIKADVPKIFLDVLKTKLDLTIKSHILWNVDNLTKIPKNYFSGNNKEIVQNYTLLGKDLKLKIFFPEQKFGRELNSTTTVILYIILQWLNQTILVNIQIILFLMIQQYYIVLIIFDCLELQQIA